MKTYVTLLTFCLIAFTSCKKNPSTPSTLLPNPVIEMEYTNLNDKEVKYQQSAVVIDVNKDNRADIIFETLLTGDFIHKIDKLKFQVLTNITTALPVNNNEQVPVMNPNETITINNFNGYEWYGGSEIVLMERQENAIGNMSWSGNWLGTQKKYLPFQIYQNNKRYNGWVEVSADNISQRLVIHRFAHCKQAEVSIIAGK
ncbi:MAG: hypothetical protein ACOVNY_07265 [Chitinophagaceae bacterium]